MRPVSMVGRADELGELAQIWTLVANQDVAATRTVVITGAAGLGKSLLTAAALGSFVPVPVTVLSGRARVHTPAPYDWLAAALCGRDIAGLPVPPDALAWLAQHPDAPTERYAPGALLRLAVRVVRALIGAGPAVLVAEDLHALDPASLNLIAELAATPDLPALLLVTSRPPGTALFPHLAAQTLARLAGMPGAVRQHLSPLRTDDVAAILSQRYPPSQVVGELASVVRERTGGNPYWLTELLAAAGDSALETLVRLPLPEHLCLTPGRTPAQVELTAREVEVLSCLAAGMSNKQVARSLGISVRTVTVHVSNLLRKTQSSSRTEVALWAVRHQLTTTAGAST